MKKLNKIQSQYLNKLFALSKKDMPIGIDRKHFLEHLKGNCDFDYNEFYSSVILNCNDLKNKQKLDLIGRQLSFILAESLEDEYYELSKNLATYFEKINYQIEWINSYILNYKINNK
jgi:hypothetical protein